MLLVVDVGNTNTVVGAFDLEGGRAGAVRATGASRRARAAPPTSTPPRCTSCFSWRGLPWKIEGGIVATVVPPALFAVEQFFEQHLQVRPLVVGPGIKTGMPILYDNPQEVGADRIVNAVAAYERFKSGCIIVDFGTATTFDLVTPKGEYAGGAIATGITTSADALYREGGQAAARRVHAARRRWSARTPWPRCRPASSTATSGSSTRS